MADRFRIPVEQAEMASSPRRPSKAENLGEDPDWLGLRWQLVKRAQSKGGRGDAEDLAQEAVLRVLMAMRSKALSDAARYAIRAVDRLRVDRWRRSRLVLEEPLLPEELAGKCKATEFAWLEARRCLHQAALDSGFSPLEAAVFVSVRFDGAAWREACAEVGLEGKGAEAAQRRISRFLSEDGLSERLYARVAELRFAQPPTPNPQPPTP